MAQAVDGDCKAVSATQRAEITSLEEARVVLWKSIADDEMGGTPEGAAVRATLFAFYPPAEKDGPLDAVALFCGFFVRAGLSQAAQVRAFHQQWPQNVA